MALSPTALGDAFEVIADVDNPADAAQAWADAFDTYFQDATVPAVGATVLPGVTGAATTAMAGAMTSLIQTDFPTALQAGVIAYWAGCVTLTGSGLFTVVAPPLTIIVPPVLLATPANGLRDAISAVGLANKASGLNRADAAQAFAVALHPFNLGGTATQVIPPPTPHPIL